MTKIGKVKDIDNGYIYVEYLDKGIQLAYVPVSLCNKTIYLPGDMVFLTFEGNLVISISLMEVKGKTR